MYVMYYNSQIAQWVSEVRVAIHSPGCSLVLCCCVFFND